MYYTYILAGRKNGTLYIGMTNDLVRRIWEHKAAEVEGFTKQYRVHMLVYFEAFPDPYSAIVREKQLKRWKREWKIRLIEESNPDWNDLAMSIEEFGFLPAQE